MSGETVEQRIKHLIRVMISAIFEINFTVQSAPHAAESYDLFHPEKVLRVSLS